MKTKKIVNKTREIVNAAFKLNPIKMKYVKCNFSAKKITRRTVKRKKIVTSGCFK